MKSCSSKNQMKFSIDFSNNTKLFLTLKKNKIYWLLRHFEDSILAYTKDYIQKNVYIYVSWQSRYFWILLLVSFFLNYIAWILIFAMPPSQGATSEAWVMLHSTTLNIPSQHSGALWNWGEWKGLSLLWLLISLSIWSVYPFLTEGTFSLLSLSSSSLLQHLSALARTR